MSDGIIWLIHDITSVPAPIGNVKTTLDDFKDIFAVLTINTNQKMNNPKEETSALRPSDEARKMKRDQDIVHENNVIALLNKRTEHRNALKQIDVDLDAIGYNWPMTAPEPKRLTEAEWLALLDVNNKIIVFKGYIDDLQQDNSNLQNQVKLQMAKVARLQKKLKSKPAKKK